MNVLLALLTEVFGAIIFTFSGIFILLLPWLIIAGIIFLVDFTDELSHKIFG